MSLLHKIADDAIEWLMLILVVGLVANVAIAAPPSGTAGQQSAYEYALRCWAVAGYLASEPGVKSNPQASAKATASARRVFDAAMRMGGLLGYSRAQIGEDLDAAGRVEGALMLRDRAYYERNRADCQQLGLT